MGLDVLLEILGPLERLATEVALVRLQRDVDTDVRSDVVSLDCRRTAAGPLTGEVEVVGRLAPNMALTDVIIKNLWCRKPLIAGVPAADEGVIGSCRC